MKADTALILAAGRGSRMNLLTQNKPKCLINLGGKSLLEWQLSSLKNSGIKKIIVVRGYLGNCIYGDFETIDNPNWQTSNMVSTMLCAFSKIYDERTVIVSYSDIVYRKSHVKALQEAVGDIVITYDKDWKSLWTLRQENPIIDAETFLEQNGLLREIGGVPSHIKEVQGQYMGLLKITSKGREKIRKFVNSLTKSEIAHLDMTSLLSKLLKTGETIHTCQVSGGWCECDTQKDIDCYEKMLKEQNWSHDWR